MPTLTMPDASVVCDMSAFLGKLFINGTETNDPEFKVQDD